MRIAAWVAVVLFFAAFVAASVQAPRVTWQVFVAAGLVAFALAYALSVSHVTVT